MAPPEKKEADKKEPEKKEPEKKEPEKKDRGSRRTKSVRKFSEENDGRVLRHNAGAVMLSDEKEGVLASAYIVPVKHIKAPGDVKQWEKSKGYKELCGFINFHNSEIRGKRDTDNFYISPQVLKVVEMLTSFTIWIDDFPPVKQDARYGNSSFRAWLGKVAESCGKIILDMLPKYTEGAVKELKLYLIESFGNPTRLDYGSGHELNFIIFLCCMCLIDALTTEDAPAVVLYIFKHYLKLCRTLQSRYSLEPAGSRGVWGLDDFHFMPFLWGSSQLCDHRDLNPRDFPRPVVVMKYYSEYMFMDCIRHIYETKGEAFAEHSNQLWNISAVLTWDKINTGMIKMYKGEILGKFPIVQHIRFGSILKAEDWVDEYSVPAAIAQQKVGILKLDPKAMLAKPDK